jgi:hypothetical protein
MSNHYFGNQGKALATGQTTSYATGDDGDLQIGKVASPRFVDNADGTISDRITGMLWCKQPEKIDIENGTGQTGTHKGAWTAALGAIAQGDVVDASVRTWAVDLDFAVGSHCFRNSVWYTCSAAHMSSEKQPLSDPDWEDFWLEITSFPTWVGETLYEVDDYVDYDGTKYICILEHTGDTYEPGVSANWEDKWDLLTIEGEWADSTSYSTDDYVTYYGTIYKCKQNHTSDAENDEPDFGINWTDYWYSGVMADSWTTEYGTYSVDDMAENSGSYYICTGEHSSAGIIPTNATYFTRVDNTAWADDTSYTLGDHTHAGGGRIFVALSTHESSEQQPTVNTNWADFWDVATPLTDWASDTAYTAADTVRRSATHMYRAKTTHRSNAAQPEMDTGWGDFWSTDSGYNSAWADSTSYSVDDKVLYSGMGCYVCILQHTSDEFNDAPGFGENWETYWVADTGCPNWSGGLYEVGDHVYEDMGGAVYECDVEHYANAKQPGVDTGWASSWEEIKIGRWICNNAHTAAADKEPPNDTYWGETEWCLAGIDYDPVIGAWADELVKINAVSWNGYSDWRLPSIAELLTLLDFSNATSMTPTTFFPNLSTTAYISGTTDPSNTAKAYALNLQTGLITSVAKSTSAPTLFVR